MLEKKIYKILMIILIVVATGALLLAIYFLPPVHNRLSWRVANLRAEIYYFFNPPGELAFSPVQQAEMEEIVRMTQMSLETEITVTFTPTMTPADFIDPTQTQTATPTQTPTLIPQAVLLDDVVHEYQSMNNCGPATLSMALSYWGWDGDQRDTKLWLRPHPEDRNVMPNEMEDSVRNHTGLNALTRWGGDIEMIKKFIAAGFPVIIERDRIDVSPDEDWMGHYVVVTGYDDNTGRFFTQDSMVSADYPLPYGVVERSWRAFNYVYVVIYPPDREAEIFSILGPHADEAYNHQYAAQKAQQEIPVLEGRDLFFAWFNYGTSLVNLADYYGAAQAYDHAFKTVYREIPDLAQPWRMMWYQTGPYFAYYHTQRYHDVIELANVTLENSGVTEIEETWVWRARARVALGNVEGAITDYRQALKYRPGWESVEAELRKLGVEP